MPHGRALVFSGLMVVLAGGPGWSRKPPEIVYPTTHDQQSLEELFKKSQHSQPEPERPHPRAAGPTSSLNEQVRPTHELTRGTHDPSPDRRGELNTANPLPSGEGGPPKAVGEAPPTYKVWIWQENGDTLWRIAEKIYGDRTKWPLIYEANRDVIHDPNKIYPKQVLKIPPPDWQP